MSDYNFIFEYQDFWCGQKEKKTYGRFITELKVEISIWTLFPTSVYWKA